jgi:hypothetical protein
MLMMSYGGGRGRILTSYRRPFMTEWVLSVDVGFHSDDAPTAGETAVVWVAV